MTDLGRAFPSYLREPVAASVMGLLAADLPPRGDITITHAREWPPILVEGEVVHIPVRIYNLVPRKRLAPVGSDIDLAVSCLYTRHHDGHVRQAALQRVLTSVQPWSIPFIVQLCGEYVVEICQDLDNFANGKTAHPKLTDNFDRFATDNPSFLDLTRRRALSYWNAYYRHDYRTPDAYPGVSALLALFHRPALRGRVVGQGSRGPR